MPYLVPACPFNTMGMRTIRLPRVTVSMACHQFIPAATRPLARTTAFPATALCDLIARSRVDFRGAAAMHAVAPADKLLPELETVGIHVDNR